MSREKKHPIKFPTEKIIKAAISKSLKDIYDHNLNHKYFHILIITCILILVCLFFDIFPLYIF